VGRHARGPATPRAALPAGSWLARLGLPRIAGCALRAARHTRGVFHRRRWLHVPRG
jgi:hypothetical protein